MTLRSSARSHDVHVCFEDVWMCIQGVREGALNACRAHEAFL